MLVNFIHVPKTGGMSLKRICGHLDNHPIRYNPHYADIYDPRIENQLIVVRNPLDRFISAVKYTIQSLKILHTVNRATGALVSTKRISVPTFIGKNKAQIFSRLFHLGVHTSNDWIEILKDKTHKYHDALSYIILNNEFPELKVGPQKCEYIYLFEPQCSWHHRPKFVILMDHFQSELTFLLTSLGVDVDIPHTNRDVSVSDHKISEKNFNWIQEKYAKDFELYYNYKETPYIERIKC